MTNKINYSGSLREVNEGKPEISSYQQDVEFEGRKYTVTLRFKGAIDINDPGVEVKAQMDSQIEKMVKIAKICGLGESTNHLEALTLKDKELTGHGTNSDGRQVSVNLIKHYKEIKKATSDPDEQAKWDGKIKEIKTIIGIFDAKVGKSTKTTVTEYEVKPETKLVEKERKSRNIEGKSKERATEAAKPENAVELEPASISVASSSPKVSYVAQVNVIEENIGKAEAKLKEISEARHENLVLQFNNYQVLEMDMRQFPEKVDGKGSAQVVVKNNRLRLDFNKVNMELHEDLQRDLVNIQHAYNQLPKDSPEARSMKAKIIQLNSLMARESMSTSPTKAFEGKIRQYAAVVIKKEEMLTRNSALKAKKSGIDELLNQMNRMIVEANVKTKKSFTNQRDKFIKESTQIEKELTQKVKPLKNREKLEKRREDILGKIGNLTGSQLKRSLDSLNKLNRALAQLPTDDELDTITKEITNSLKHPGNHVLSPDDAKRQNIYDKHLMWGESHLNVALTGPR